MIHISIRFYAELNDALPPEMRFRDNDLDIKQGQTVSDVLKQHNINISQVEIIMVNGDSKDESYLLQNNDRISVFPMFETLNVSSLLKLRDETLRDVRFVCDVHFGKLARYLRLLGFDTLYRSDFKDTELVSVSLNEKRVLLSMDKELIGTSSLTHALLIRERKIEKQLMMVMERFDLFALALPFTRCMVCNKVLEVKNKEEVLHLLPPKSGQYYNEFLYCSGCQRYYWKGSHYKKMREFVSAILG